jgi:hypothetical protein
MLDEQLTRLRHDVAASIDVPGFDDLVVRGRRRRRRRLALSAAAVAVVAGVAATGLSPALERDATPPVNEPDTWSEPRQPADILDEADAQLYVYEAGPDGFQLSVWAPDQCNDTICPVAFAWSDDGWQTRDDRLFSDWVDVYPVGRTVVVYPEDGAEFLLTDRGERIDLGQPEPPRPATAGEVLIDTSSPRGIAMVDLATGATHRIPLPRHLTLTWVDRVEGGRLVAIGNRGDQGVYATSDDGGRTWQEQPIPAIRSGATANVSADRAVVALRGVDGLELTIITEQGTNVTVVDDLPFGSADCLDLTDGPLLVSSGSRLFRSTDDSWTEFEDITPDSGARCPRTNGQVTTALAADMRSGLVSRDFGDTWKTVDPR